MQQLRYTLSGTITDLNNQLLDGFWVKVIFQKPQQPKIESVAPVLTNPQGKYEITFNLSDFNIDEAAYMEPDVFIQVLDPVTEAVLRESEIKSNILFKAEINLQVNYPLQPEEPKVAPPSITIKGTVLDRLQRSLKNAIVQLWEDGASSYTLESEPTQQDGAFQLELTGDLFDIAMDCTEFHFKVLYQDKIVANTQEQEPPITWDIGKEKDAHIEITTNITGIVKEELQQKVIAVSFAKQAHLSLNAFPKTHKNLRAKAMELAAQEILNQLQTAFGESLDTDLKEHVKDIDFTNCASKKLEIKDYIKTQLQKQDIGQRQFDTITKKLEAAALPKTFSDFLPEDKPLKEIPLLQTFLEEGEAHQLAEVAGLKDATCINILQKGWRVNDSDFRVLDALKEDGSLTETETADLKQITELHTLFDAQVPLTHALKNGPMPGTSYKMKELKDLVGVRAKNWEKLITDSNDLTLPKDISKSDYATLLEKRVERAFPTAAMLSRYQSVKKTDLAEGFKNMGNILEQAPDLLKTKNIAAVDFSGMTKTEVAAVKENYNDTLKKLNRYHGLNVHRISKEAINKNGVIDFDKHLGSVETKIQQLETFYENNKNKELLAIDFGPEADLEAQGLDFTDVLDENKVLICRNIKTKQRTLDLAFGDLKIADKLLENGIYSATQIADLSISSLTNKLDLESNQVVGIYNRACLRKRQTMDWLVKAIDYRNDASTPIKIGNLTPISFVEKLGRTEKVPETFEDKVLRRYDGYTDYFGSLDYCNCNHCSSIFSPAAYFADLMGWLEKMVLNDVFLDKVDHRLHLQNRRPDLWYLDLSCENTNTSIPYLDIINEVMENYIFYLEKSSDDTESLYYNKTPFQTIQNIADNRESIISEVYRSINEKEKVYSIQAPFLLPLEELKVYLKHFPISLEEVALTLGNQDDMLLTRARLGISKAEFDILTKSNTYNTIDTPQMLSILFDTELVDSNNNFIPIDVQQLLKVLEVSRKELGQLVKTRFVNFYLSLNANSFEIRSKKNNDKDVQNNIELLDGAVVFEDNSIKTIPNIDRLHRFTRLWKKTPWSIQELDLVLRKVVNEHHGISEEVLQKQYQNVVKVFSLYQRFNKSIDEVMALFITMEWVPQGIFGRLFNNRFNKPPFTNTDRYPKSKFDFIHPVFENSSEESAKELPRLLAGLGITDAQLYHLINGDSPLFNALLNVDEKVNHPKFALSAPNLSLLYRHARLAEYLGLKIPELFRLMDLSEEKSKSYIAHGELEKLEQLLKFYDWWKTTAYSLEELEFLLPIENRNLKSELTTQSEELPTEILKTIDKDRATVFTDTIFAYLDGVTESQSKEIILYNIKHQFLGLDSNYTLLLPQNLDIKDKSVSATDSPLFTNAEVQEKLKSFLETFSKDVAVDLNLFYDHRTQIGLEKTLTKEVSAQLFTLNRLLFEVYSKNSIKQASTKAYRILETVKNVDIDALGLNDEKQKQYLKARKNDGAAAITLADLEREHINFTIVTPVLEEIPNTNVFELTEFYANSLLVPAHIPVTTTEVNNAIAKYKMDSVLKFYIAEALKISTIKVDALSKLSGIQDGHSNFASNDDHISNWVKAIHKLSIVYKAKEYAVLSLEKTEENEIVIADLINVLQSLTLAKPINKVFLDKINLLRPFLAEDTLSNLVSILKEKINPSVEIYDVTDQKFVNDDTYTDLKLLLHTELTPIKLVNEQGDLGDNAITALVNLDKRVKLSEYLGIGGNILQHLLSEDYDKLAIARNALLSAFRLKYNDDKQWEEKIEPFHDTIRGLKRDALTDYLINGLENETVNGKSEKWFPNRREIYKHFLIDTELEGCARTSRLVAATSSVQLFIQRILLNLETSNDIQDGNPKIIIRPKETEDQQLFKSQWEWRKNYRVWEANRKVFLYPENYIEPSLRDNKTELFTELENDLLQREINADTVEEAYKKYMDGFEEVNNLQVAGAYHEKEIDGEGESIRPETSKDIIHLFAVTPGDENQLYYRKIENTYLSGLDDVEINWNSWEKVNLKIESNSVYPVVVSESLYLFWLTQKVLPHNTKIDSTNIFNGYKVEYNIQFSRKQESLDWKPIRKMEEKFKVIAPLYRIEDLQHLYLERKYRVNHNYIAVKDLDGYPANRLEQIKLAKKIHKELIDNIDAFKDKILNKEDIHLQFNPAIPLENDNKIEEILFFNKYYEGFSDGYQNYILDLFKINDEKIHFEPSSDFKLKYVETYYNQEFIRNNQEIIISLSFPNYKKEGVLDVIDGRIMKVSPELETSVNLIKNWYNELDWYLPLHQTHGPRYLTSINLEGFNKYQLTGYLNSRNTAISINPQEKYKISTLYGDSLGGILIENKSLQEVAAIIPINRNLVNQINLKTPLYLELGKNNFSTKFRIKEKLKDYLSFKHQRQVHAKLSSDVLKSENSNYVSIIFEQNQFKLLSENSIYLWELFFHIPFLIANYLNSQLKYVDAQQWYHYIFNPAAVPFKGILEDELKDKKYVWQFRAFFEHDIASMRKALTKPASLRVYENDPFNPHALARTRISAYQKAVVMKYIDNLLDWGDQLFAQDTMESINEATMLYIFAYEILGDRPADIGDCGEKKGKKTYQGIKTNSTLADNKKSEPLPILIEEVETQYIPKNVYRNPRAFMASNWSNSKTTAKSSYEVCSKESVIPNIIRPVFCIHKNKDLMAYWDRVDDRLFKIRNCMNIRGIKRDLALFAPEIDPRLLVRAKAQGLSIQQALESLNGQLPPYRFAFLMAKAKEYVGLVQGFGSALQGALERKDAEFMTQLQATHQKNIANMSHYIKDRELEAAEANLETLLKRKQATQNRLDYYKSLISTDLNTGERAQISYKNTADGFYVTSLAMSTIAGILGMTPNIVGMSNEVVPAFKALSIYSSYFKFFAELNNLKSSAAGLNANFARRKEGWKFQLNSTKDELKIIDEQIKGAEISKAITQRNYEIFEQSIVQQDEVFDFIKDKFSNLGLYTWLSSQLSRLYREAWNSAFTMAKMAERAYRFERSDDTSPLLNGNYWDSSHHGLLAGQNLLIDLQNLERRYIETHHRKMEIDQSFSLMQIDPKALLDLKQKGECNFSVPELFFDLSYPGQYKRRIRSARLTIPCIVGPYVNVGATLSLTGSRIRVEPKLEPSLKEMPPTRTTTIATSTAQNDSGVFEFSFRDERYMPFEGAGAISDWHLKLPKSFRPFDYNTINDVILHISYEADYDGVLAEKVENGNKEIQNSITNVLQDKGLSRLFSLRQEFSDTFHKLLYKSDIGASFEIRDKHFPIFVQGKLNPLNSVSVSIYVITDIRSENLKDRTISVHINDIEVNDLAIKTQGQESFVVFEGNGNLASLLGSHDIKIEFPSIDNNSDDDERITKDQIKDVLLYFEYKI